MPEAHGDTDPSIAARVRDLYGVALADFVRARDLLVRAVRAEGDRDAATRIAALRRPSPGAWALNQVARHDAATVDELLATAEAMRVATQKALEGDASALREIAPREREAVRRLVAAAADELRTSGKAPSDAVTQRLAVTVRSVLADESLGELLRIGMLTDDLQPSGLGIETLVFDESLLRATTPARRTAPKASGDAHEPEDATDVEPADAEETDAENSDPDAIERARAARAARQREVEELEREADRLDEAAAALDDTARAAETTAREQRRAADRAAAEAGKAKDAAAAARARFDADET